MKINFALCTAIILLLTISADAQPVIYIPLNVRDAYEKQTRAPDGSPGKNYWQNSSVYKIKVSVDPAEKLITGSGEIEYSNNSPDSLTEIVVRLYQNIYKPGAERDFPLKDEDLTKGVRITKFEFNGMETAIEGNPDVSIEGTNLIYKPEKPLNAGLDSSGISMFQSAI
jgi:hypothetical protein